LIALRFLILGLALLAAPILAQPRPVAMISMASLTGELCSARKSGGAGTGLVFAPQQEIVCDNASAGRISYVTAPTGLLTAVGDARRALMISVYAENRRKTGAAERRSCGEPKWLAAGSAEIMVFPCFSKDGGWAELVIVGVTGSEMSIAEGGVALYPLLRAATGAPLESDDRTAIISEVQTFWKVPVVLASASQVDSINSLLRKARVAAGQSDHMVAEGLFRQALEVQNRLFGEFSLAVADTLMDLAIEVSSQQRHEDGQALLRRATSIIARSPSDIDQARLSTYEGYLAANRADYASAGAFARSARELWRAVAARESERPILGGAELGNEMAQAELAMTLNLEASMLLRIGDVTSAFAAAGEALLILNRVSGQPRWWKADVLLTLGEISSAQGRLSAAEAYLNGALALRQKVFGEGAGTLRIRAALGRAYSAESMNTSAIIAYREVLNQARLMPKAAIPLIADDLVPFAAAVIDYSRTIDDAQEKLGLYTEAFDAFQMVRVPLADRSAAQSASRLSVDNPELSDLLRKSADTKLAVGVARIKLSREQSLPDEERSSETERELISEIKSQTQIAATQHENLVRRFPDFVALSETKQPALDAIRSRLRDKEGLVMFLIGTERSFVQLVRRDGIVIAAVPAGEAALEYAVTRLRSGLEVQGRSVKDFDLEAAHRLYLDLFGGLKTEMASLDELIVVPSGPLASLPFSLLLTAPAAPGDYKGAKWLLNEITISHTPSSAALVALRETRLGGRPSKLMLAFGNPVLGLPLSDSAQRTTLLTVSSACQTGAPTSPTLLRTLSSLPDTAAELTSVAQTLGKEKSDVLLGQAADEHALRLKNLNDYRIIYFATHGLLPGELRCQSEPGLVLSPPPLPAQTRAADGLLEASEVASLSIKAELVVLSACNTAAAGKKFGGESLSGLAEAFFHAGARSLLVSHWQVPSAATTALMSNLFSALAGKPDGAVDLALRTAQLGLIRDSKTAHPFFWAAFVVMGDGATKPLQERQSV